MLAIETYEVLKFFHVLFAIVAVGSTTRTAPSGSQRSSRPRPGAWSSAIDPAQRRPCGSAAASFIRTAPTSPDVPNPAA